MPQRPVEDAIIERQREEALLKVLLTRLKLGRERTGKTPSSFVVCHLMSQGWRAAEIARDYGCQRSAITRRTKLIDEIRGRLA